MNKPIKIYYWINRIVWCILLVNFSVRMIAQDSEAQVVIRKSFVPDSILTHIFNMASIHSETVKEYNAELYLKGNLQIHHQNRIIKYIPSMFRFEKGISRYIHESISDLHYTAPNIYDRKIRAVSTTFPGGESPFPFGYYLLLCL